MLGFIRNHVVLSGCRQVRGLGEFGGICIFQLYSQSGFDAGECWGRFRTQACCSLWMWPENLVE
jgi:hypothetical protein